MSAESPRLSFSATSSHLPHQESLASLCPPPPSFHHRDCVTLVSWVTGPPTPLSSASSCLYSSISYLLSLSPFVAPQQAPIHNSAPTFEEQGKSQEILVTGIKVCRCTIDEERFFAYPPAGTSFILSLLEFSVSTHVLLSRHSSSCFSSSFCAVVPYFPSVFQLKKTLVRFLRIASITV